MKKIILLATGGTIACVPGADGLAPGVTAAQLLARTPQLNRLAEMTGRDVFSLDSSNIQPEEWRVLARAARDRGLDVWTYTGWTYEQLLTEGDPDRLALLDATDVLVDGPFVAARKSYAALFRGSDNQRLIDLRKTEREGRVVLWTRPDPLAHFTVPES